ncbi:unnamed protein product [Closterium sp. Naga37s-1]|nr:unnamed protein product [Closterium sp. Naga37s-1]
MISGAPIGGAPIGGAPIGGALVGGEDQRRTRQVLLENLTTDATRLSPTQCCCLLDGRGDQMEAELIVIAGCHCV